METEHCLFMVAPEDLMDQPPSCDTRPEGAWEAAQGRQVAPLDDEGEEEGYERGWDGVVPWEGFNCVRDMAVDRFWTGRHCAARKDSG